MGDAGRRSDDAVELVGPGVEPVEEAGAAAEDDRRDVKLEPVHVPRREVLLDGSAPPAMWMPASPAAARACASADSIPSVTKVKVVSRVGGPNFNGSRSWWVRTKTGMWNGGSSPHQPSNGSSPHGPSWPLNILRPMITAPLPPRCSLRISSSTVPFSPPSRPCCSRQDQTRIAHSCSWSPPVPSGCSGVGSGPALNPSRDTEMSKVTFCMRWRLPVAVELIAAAR